MVTSGKSGRPSIPLSVQNELWARAAGRCEFRGCNELVFLDPLTQKRSNISAISHIVAYSPDGPRGDVFRSKKLEKDITNLILTCRKHGKVIDDHDKVDEYSEELLLEFKREHEDRIRMLTEIREDAQTHVLLVQAPIDGRDFAIDQTRAFQAVLPKYPAEETAELIDLCGMALPATTDGFFRLMAESLSDQVRTLLRRRPGKPRIRTLSLFALAPVPLLVHLGRELGDIQQVDLFQKHRRGEGWAWTHDEAAEEFYEVTRAEPDEQDGPLALVLAISSEVNMIQAEAALGTPPVRYAIHANKPGVDFLVSRKRLEVFGYELRSLLADIRRAHGHDRRVHVFAAVPAPVAVELGRSIKDFDPEFVIYEYDKKNRSYFPALTVNCRREA